MGNPTGRVTILDGGTGRELKAIGAPFAQPEWSALALVEAPEYVTEVHRAFAEAGAEVITTNAYAVVPFHIGQQRFDDDGARLARLAAELAREVGDEFGITVAGSLPPALGSYQPGGFDRDAAATITDLLMRAQAPFVDVWLSETVSSLDEARVAADVVATDDEPRPWWVSFTLADHLNVDEGAKTARLRSGESVSEAVAAGIEWGADLVGFNCSPPEVMEPAVREARSVAPHIPIAVYANAFDLGDSSHEEGSGANSALYEMRTDLDPTSYSGIAQRWVDAGATVVGGCCGIGSQQIRQLADHFHPIGS